MVKSGFMGGLLGTHFLSNRFAIKSGFLYENRGFKKSKNILYLLKSFNFPYNINLNLKEKYSINALTIPFYGQYEVGCKLKALFYAGPYVSIPLNTKMNFEEEKISCENANLVYQYLNSITNLSLLTIHPSIINTYENPDIEFGVSVGTGLIIPMNDTIDFVGDVSYKIEINKSLEESSLYDLGATIGLRYRF